MIERLFEAWVEVHAVVGVFAILFAAFVFEVWVVVKIWRLARSMWNDFR